MISTELKTLATSLNGDAPIDDTLLESLLNVGKTILEGERDWMALRKTSHSIAVSASSTNQWNTGVSISTITDFLRFYGDFPIKLFDGNNIIEYYRQVPFSKRLEYKDTPGTFVFDIANKTIYFNGNINVSGTLYIDYIVDTASISLAVITDIQTNGSFPFPSRFHPILAFYSIGINKGAIDYDSINREMLPQHQATLIAIKGSMETYDTKMQLDEQMQSDPSGLDTQLYRPGMVNMNN